MNRVTVRQDCKVHNKTEADLEVHWYCQQWSEVRLVMSRAHVLQWWVIHYLALLY